MRVAAYRPFTKHWCYFDRQLNAMMYQMPSMFPTREHRSPGIVMLAGSPRTPFGVLMVDDLPDSKFLVDAGQFYPRWTYRDGGDNHLLTGGDGCAAPAAFQRIDNITDRTLASIRAATDETITKDDIFYYVYAVLHHPVYRETFAADLKKLQPRIPLPRSTDQFQRLASAGRTLAELHLNYESVDPYLLEEQTTETLLSDDPDRWRVTKLRWKSKADHSAIVYNAHLTLAGIPDEAHEYRLGSRTALEWLIDRYQVTTDKKSGIVNDPNDWGGEHGDPRYIVDLVKRVTAVSVETARLVKNLPGLDLG